MRRRAGLESDFAGRQRAERAQNLVVGELPIEDHFVRFVGGANLKPVLGDIQSDSAIRRMMTAPFATAPAAEPAPPGWATLSANKAADAAPKRQSSIDFTKHLTSI